MIPLFEKKKVVPETVEQPLISLSSELSNPAPMDALPQDTQEKEVDFSKVMEGISAGGDEQTAIGGIMELTRVDDGKEPTKNLAIKSIVPHAGAFTAGQWMATYNDNLGMTQVGDALRMLCDWMYIHNCAFKGKRSEQAFGALKEEMQKEFQLVKESKGLLNR